jgi:hypothetical protein
LDAAQASAGARLSVRVFARVSVPGHPASAILGPGGLVKLYAVPILPSGTSGRLRVVWRSAPAEAPYGLALARSGNAYMSLISPADYGLIEVSPTGQLLAYANTPAAAPDGSRIPWDLSSGVAFDGKEVLVTNGSSILNGPEHYAIFADNAGETGLPPSLPPGRAALPTQNARDLPGTRMRTRERRSSTDGHGRASAG